MPASTPSAVAAAEAAGTAEPGALLGRGTLAMTIDQGAHTSRYQGVVPLEGESLEEVAHTYFRQSEQIPTRVRLAVAEMHVRDDGAIRHALAGRRAGRPVPARGAGAHAPGRIFPAATRPAGADVERPLPRTMPGSRRSRWSAPIEDDELIDPAVPVERLLYRLFHERGVRVFTPGQRARPAAPARARRSPACSRRFTAEEIAESIEDGAISVTCEFCGKKYGFDPAEFARAHRRHRRRHSTSTAIAERLSIGDGSSG